MQGQRSLALAVRESESTLGACLLQYGGAGHHREAITDGAAMPRHPFQLCSLAAGQLCS